MPSNLSDDKEKLEVNKEVHREEPKSYVKDLKVVKSNLKRLYSFIYRNCSDKTNMKKSQRPSTVLSY